MTDSCSLHYMKYPNDLITEEELELFIKRAAFLASREAIKRLEVRQQRVQPLIVDGKEVGFSGLHDWTIECSDCFVVFQARVTEEGTKYAVSPSCTPNILADMY